MQTEDLLNLKVFLSLMLSGALALPVPGLGQEVSGPKSNVVQEGGSLKMVVLKGEGVVNSIKGRTATAPVVEVRDQNDKPVTGAEVVFQLPAAGPGAVFNGWMRTQTVRTDAQGQAAATGMTPNDEPGRFNIKVTATNGTRSTSVIVAQSNAAGGANGKQARGSKKALWVVLGLAAVGGLAGGIAATRGGDSTTSAARTNPITITPGPVTVAAPR